jgi:hypothetical protein
MDMHRDLLNSSSTCHRLLASLLHLVVGGIVFNAYGTLPRTRSYPPMPTAGLHQHRQVLAHSGGSTPEV